VIDIDRVRELASRGLTAVEAAKEYKEISYSTLSRWLRKDAPVDIKNMFNKNSTKKQIETNKKVKKSYEIGWALHGIRTKK
jgi:orotate phosphoribosyltransferase-like protein